MDVPNGYDDVCDDANHNPHEISTQIVDETVDDTSEVVESTLMNEVETRSEVDSNGFVEVESAIVEYDSDTMTEGESNDSDSDSRRNRDVMRSDMTILDTITGGSDECELSVNQYPSAQDLDADLACMPPADNQNLETNERSTHLQGKSWDFRYKQIQRINAGVLLMCHRAATIPRLSRQRLVLSAPTSILSTISTSTALPVVR